MEQRVDLRVIKTRRNIQDSFVRLLQQKNFERITVQNLLDEALINRTTFYRHYLDKYDLADSLIEELLESFKANINERFVVCHEDLNVVLRQFYISLFQKKDKMLALFDVRTLKYHLSEDIRTVLKEIFREFKPMGVNPPSELELSYQCELYASVVLTSVKWLLELGDEDGIDIIIDKSVKKVGEMIKTITELS